VSVEARDSDRRRRPLPVCEAGRRMRTVAVEHTGSSSAVRNVIFNERLAVCVYSTSYFLPF